MKYRRALPSTSCDGRHSLPDMWLRATWSVKTSGSGMASALMPIWRTVAAMSSDESRPMLERRSFTFLL